MLVSVGGTKTPFSLLSEAASLLGQLLRRSKAKDEKFIPAVFAFYLPAETSFCTPWANLIPSVQNNKKNGIFSEQT